MQATQIPKNQIYKSKMARQICCSHDASVCIPNRFQKFFLLFTRFLLSESPSVSFGVTWLLFVLVNDLMLEVSGSLALWTCCWILPAAICLPSGPCVYLLGSGSLVSLVSEVEWYYPC